MRPRYELLTPAELAAKSPPERAAYQRQREAFDREVEEHKAHIAEHGWINVAPPGGKPTPYYARCGERVDVLGKGGRVIGTGPCLKRRQHDGQHSPAWDGAS